MTNEEKLKIFEKYLSMIEDINIKDFTEFCLLRVPDYFWTMPATTSGRRHGGSDETLIDHIRACLFLAENVFEQMKDIWSSKDKDRLISALILHDTFRCHEDENTICYYTENDVKNRDPKLLGKLRTSRRHAETAFIMIGKFAEDFKTLPKEDLDIILRAIRLHLGPWSVKNIDDKFPLDGKFNDVVVRCHDIDAMNAWNACWYRKGE